VTGGEGNVATLAPAALTSDLVDLTAIPLDELRDLHTQELDLAIQRMYERTATARNDIQEQRG
jgi:hypothetical protein